MWIQRFGSCDSWWHMRSWEIKKLECILLCPFNSIFNFLLLVGCAFGTALVSLVVVLYSNLSDSNEGFTVRTQDIVHRLQRSVLVPY